MKNAKEYSHCASLPQLPLPLASTLIVGGLLMWAPQAHAGSWDITIEAAHTHVGTSWDYGTNQQQPTDFTRNETWVSQTAPSFSYKSYPLTPAEADQGTTSTFDHSVSINLHLHYNADSASDLPPRMIAVQLRGKVGGYFDLPPDDFTGGGGSLTGTTGLEDSPAVITSSTGSAPIRTVVQNGRSVKVCFNPTRSADLTVGPLVLNHKGSISSASKITVFSYGGSTYTNTTYTDAKVYADLNLEGELADLSVSPSPDNLALDDGTGSTSPLNQSTIDVGVPTSVSLSSSDAASIEWLRLHSSWTLSGPSPALRPVLTARSNFKEVSGNSAIIGPVHYTPIPTPEPGMPPQPTPTPMHGLRFNLETSATPSAFSNG